MIHNPVGPVTGQRRGQAGGRMNRIYHLVFNRTLGLIQVAPETARARKKGTSAGGVVGAVGLALTLASLPVAAQVALDQLPKGEVIRGGIGTITRENGEMRINQSEPRAVIDWNEFDIGGSAGVIFDQQTYDVVLNQILGVDPS